MSVRPWKRGTAAARAANVTVPTAGELGVETDTGNLVVSDGVTSWSALKRLVRLDEVTTAVQQYVTSLVLTNSSLTTLASSTGYVYAIVDQNGRIALGVQPNGNIIAKFSLTNGQVTAVQLSSDVQSRLLSDATLQAALNPLSTGKTESSGTLGTLTVAFADQAGNLALGIDTAGHVYVPRQVFAPGTIHAAALATDVSVPTSISSAMAVWALTDQTGKVVLWVTPDGSVEVAKFGSSTRTQIQAIVAALGVGPAQQWQSTYQSTVHQTASGPNFLCPGDSLTAGAGGGGTTYPGVLQSLMTTAGNTGTVYNYGIGGETSVTITARTNAIPLSLLPDSATAVPAGTTPIQVDLQQLNGAPTLPLLQGSYGSTGTLYTENGPVAGSIGLVQPGGSSSTFTPGTDYYTFARTTAGSAINWARPAAFVFDFAQAHRDDIHVIWIGQNGPSDARAQTDAQAVVDHLSALHKRYIVMNRPSSTDADDAAWFSLFGRHYIPIRKYLMTYGLPDAGITPTSQDTTDISNGSVPSSLISPTALRPHLTPAGYTVVGTQVYLRAREFGWVL